MQKQKKGAGADDRPKIKMAQSMKPAAIAPQAVSALLATVGLGVVGWAVTVMRIGGMDMGVATTLGSFAFFLSVWIPMMAAMMLPGVVPSVIRLAGSNRTALEIPRYVGTYLGVWAFFGVLVFIVYRPHGTTIAGAITIGAGVYELTPVKRRFRTRCRDGLSTGLGLGLCCVGSTVGLMLMMVTFGAMSLTLMANTAGVLLLQKLLPPRAVIDVPVALAMIGFGIAEFVK
jgi:predicted metal-binding membrane protein